MSYMKRLYMQNLEETKELRETLEELQFELHYLEHEAYSVDNRIRLLHQLILETQSKILEIEGTLDVD